MFVPLVGGRRHGKHQRRRKPVERNVWKIVGEKSPFLTETILCDFDGDLKRKMNVNEVRMNELNQNSIMCVWKEK